MIIELLEFAVCALLFFQQLPFILLHPLIIWVLVCQLDHFILVFTYLKSRLGPHGLLQLFESIKLFSLFVFFLNLKLAQVALDLGETVKLLIELILYFTWNPLFNVGHVPCLILSLFLVLGSDLLPQPRVLPVKVRGAQGRSQLELRLLHLQYGWPLSPINRLLCRHLSVEAFVCFAHPVLVG